MTGTAKNHGLTKDLSGRTFGTLIALEIVRRDRDKSGRSLIVWQCRCECGSLIETRSSNLLSGDTKSCGCQQKAATAARSRKHGHTPRTGRSPEHTAWRNMHARCSNPDTGAYPWYGGRGIAVCARWHDFESFLADLGLRPSKIHTIERIDVNGNYEPCNVRWAPLREQGANKRNNRMLSAFGETHHMQEWCRRKNISQRTLWNRLNLGWPLELALSTPPKSIRNIGKMRTGR